MLLQRKRLIALFWKNIYGCFGLPKSLLARGKVKHPIHLRECVCGAVIHTTSPKRVGLQTMIRARRWLTVGMCVPCRVNRPRTGRLRLSFATLVCAVVEKSPVVACHVESSALLPGGAPASPRCNRMRSGVDVAQVRIAWVAMPTSPAHTLSCCASLR